MVNNDNGPDLGAFLAVFWIISLVLFVLSIIAAVKIVTKAGYSGAWVLVAFVPFVNVVMIFVFAFADWPVLQQARAGRTPYSPPGGYPPGYATAPPVAGLPAPPPKWYPGGNKPGEGTAQ